MKEEERREPRTGVDELLSIMLSDSGGYVAAVPCFN